MIYDNHTTPYYPIYAIVCQAGPYGRLKIKENFILLALKLVGSASSGGHLPEVPNIVILTKKLLLFWWSLRRGDRLQGVV